jgi:hypothetical protein
VGELESFVKEDFGGVWLNLKEENWGQRKKKKTTGKRGD